MNDFLVLAAMTFAEIVYTPIYILFRRRVQKDVVDTSNQPKRFYTLTRILKITGIHFVMSAMIAIILIAVFMFVKARVGLYSWNNFEFSLLILLILDIALVGYGGGSYLASVVAEEYTLKKIREVRDFKFLNLSTEIFHGPLSHVFVFVGIQIVLFLTALLEISQGPPTVELPSPRDYLILGLIGGISYGLMQIMNNTWRHQLIWMTAVFLIYIGVIVVNRTDILSLPYNVFFLLFNFSLILTLLAKTLHHLITKDKYRYDGLVTS
ncbi:hypothetical protein HYT59_02635 [Candidatus Woesebacteria bacterium]|nr:hypothetical protein [Candidatus Woesebacteria bacterium]